MRLIFDFFMLGILSIFGQSKNKDQRKAYYENLKKNEATTKSMSSSKK